MTTGVKIGVGVAVVAVLGTGGFLAAGGPALLGDAEVGSGYAAKTVCSALFVSGRPLEDAIRDFPPNPMVDFIRTSVDEEDEQVTASIAGLGQRTARYFDGLGCILLPSDGGEIGFTPPTLPASPLPEASPLTAADPAAFDQAALDAAIDRAFTEPDTMRPVDTRAVVVLHRGRLAAERYAPGFTAETPLMGWSMNKTITGALVGILVGEGRLTLADTALYEGWPAGDPRRSITLDDLMRMSSGLEFAEAYGDLRSEVIQMLLNARDMGAFAAAQPLEAEPGRRWDYSSGTTNIISRIVRSRFADHDEYLTFPRRALFEPIGMSSAVIEPDPSGTFVGSSYMYATARDWARFGEMLRNDGTVDGRRVLPEGWVDYMTTPTPAAPEAEYGAQTWLNAGVGDARMYPRLPRDTFLLSGHDGQNVVVFPTEEIVVVRLGFSPHGNWDEEHFLDSVRRAFD